MQRFLPSTKKSFISGGIAAELGKLLASLLAAAGLIVVVRVTARIIKNNRDIKEKRQLAKDVQQEEEEARIQAATTKRAQRPLDQTFSIAGSGGRRAWSAAANNLKSTFRGIHRSGSAEQPHRVTSFGRGWAGGVSPGSTPPSGVGHHVAPQRGAPPANRGFMPPHA
jgi:hypothetical protein